MKRNVLVTIAVCSALILVPLAALAAPEGETAESDEMIITWLGQGRGDSRTDDTWVTDAIEEKFGVDIQWNGLHQDDMPEEIDIMIAAGDHPDVFFIWKDVTELYLDGVIRTMPESMVVQHMPNYTRTFREEDPLGWLMLRSPDAEDEFLSLLSSRKWLDTTFSYVAFRAHWAAAAGFDLPGYDRDKTPLDNLSITGYDTHFSFFLDHDFTVEWLEELLVAFRDGDFDGNGRADTIPWAGNKHWYWTWNPIMGAFGIARNYNVSVGGELYEWSVAPQYREFIKLAARWWQSGLLDKEYPTLSWDKWDEKNGAGLTGAAVSHFAYQSQHGITPNNMVKPEEVGTGAEVVTIPPPIGPTGMRGSPVYSPANGLRTGEFISAKVDDEKLAVILQILDYLAYGDVEQWAWVTYGKPGEHSDWVGEPLASQLRRRPQDEIGGKQWWGAEHPSIGLKKHVPLRYSTEMADFWSSYLLGDGLTYAIRPHRWDILGETQLGEVNYRYKADLDTFVDEFFFNVMTGKADVDAEWDGYVERWKQMGGDEVLAALNDAPLVSEYNQGRLTY